MDSDDHTTSNGIACRHSRRTMLSLGTAGVVSALAGCSSITGQSASGSSNSDDVFTDISFEGQQMVVELAEDHDIKQVNLIDPRGGEFASQAVASGVTEIPFQILDIENGISGFEHYQIGTYELVGERTGNKPTRDVELKPNLSITSISPHQYKNTGYIDSLKVRVRNDGTGPTWVYDIAYPEINRGTVSSPGDMAGLPKSHLVTPEKAIESVLTPNEERTFASTRQPFVFEEKSVCSDHSIEGEVVVATPLSKNPTAKFFLELSGGGKSTNPSTGRDEYYCNNISPQIKPEEQK